MKFNIFGAPDYAMIDVDLAQGESVVAESGAMVAMSANTKMTTSTRGGLLKGLKRAVLGGESLFQNTFTAENGNGRVQLAPSTPGDLKQWDLAEGQSLFMQGGCYVASTPETTLDTKWGGAKGFFSGTGMFLLKATGPGTVFVSAYGALHQVRIEGEYIVDTGHIVAFEETLTYSISKVGGLKSFFFGGEGLVARFSGHGNAWVQTRNPTSLVEFVNPFRPVKSND
ncbi:MAG: TIGR00266 family protein [Myxococcales bacterium]|nr:TIGR00266 family protein [Myxococcales bacterium]